MTEKNGFNLKTFHYPRILNKVFKHSSPKENKMGWLFSRKKAVPKVPFPEGKAFDEKSLHFPQAGSPEKVIKPEEVQAAVGLGKPVIPPEETEKAEEIPEQGEAIEQQPFTPPRAFPEQKPGPSFARVDVYRKILTELNEIKLKLNELKSISRDLNRSEYNEESSFLRLRRATKFMHDRLLQVDKILFKGN